MVTSPQVSWLFFKAVRAGLAVTKSPYLNSYGSSEQRGKTASWARPDFRQCKNGAGCALLPPVRLGPPCRRPILNATTSPLYARRCTRLEEESCVELAGTARIIRAKLHPSRSPPVNVQAGRGHSTDRYLRFPKTGNEVGFDHNRTN